MLLRNILVCIIPLLLLPSISYSYIDPATISYAFSILVGLFAGLVLYIKIIMHKINIVVRKILLLLIEIKSYYKYIFKLDVKYKDIIIYSEGKNYFSYFEGIVNELTINRSKKLTYISSDYDEKIYVDGNDNIKFIYINKLLVPFLQFLNCKIALFTLADFNQYHLKRSIYSVKYIYLFHSYVSTHMMYRFGAFNHYDSILCGGEHQLNEITEFEKKYKLKSKQKIKAGYYRIEKIYNAYKSILAEQDSNKQNKTALIAPSWGEDNLLRTCGKILITNLINHGFKVIVRPHPETVKRDSKLISELKESIFENSTYYLELTAENDDSIINADYLITDCSGIMFEYAYGTERPVISVDVPVKIKNRRYTELNIEPYELYVREKIGILIKVSEIENILNFIRILDNEEDKYKKQIIELRDKSIYSFNNSSVDSSNYIISELE